MNKLKNDFITPEQSKRLLELGVPIDSANCYLTRFGIDEDWEVKVLNNVKYSEIAISNQEYCLPCWSIGRLMQIFAICFDPDFIHFDTFADGLNFLQQMMNKFETYAKNMDFSKLEE